MSPSPTETSPELAAFARFARTTAFKKVLAEQVKQLEKELEALEPLLLNYLSQNGIQMMKVQGFTISSKRIPWIYPQSGFTRQQVCEALKLSGLGRMVSENYSTQTLTTYVRELEEHHELLTGVDSDSLRQLLPAPLAQVVEVKPTFHLQVLDRREKREKEASDFEPNLEGE